MYDSLNDIKLLSRSNDTEGFDRVGLDKVSGFKLQKMELPKWAIDWSKNRLNMDVKNVKLCIANEQNIGRPFAASSGDNIFITNEYKNNKSVLMHEITHIYQQAIGIATETNSNDKSLEKEAVRNSEDKEALLSMKQSVSDTYIIPRKNTNTIQFLGGLNIAKSIIGGLVLANTAAGAINWISKRMKCKQIAQEANIPIECVNKVYDIFDWVEYEFGYYDFEKLCRVIYNKSVSTDKLIQDNKELKNNCRQEDIYNYIESLENETGSVLTIRDNGSLDNKDLDKIKKIIIEDGVRDI